VATGISRLRITPNAIVDSATSSFATRTATLWLGAIKPNLEIKSAIDATLQDRKHNRTVKGESEAAAKKGSTAAVDRLAE